MIEIRSFAVRIFLFTTLWLVLTEGRFGNLPLAAMIVLVATGASLILSPRPSWRWRLRGLVRFAPFFFMQSVLGGVDVAKRALQPGSRLAPAMIEHRLQLPEGAPRWFFVAVLGLLPGTLSAELNGERLIVHLLDRGSGSRDTLRALEVRVADLFGVTD
jgi:multicomponent Na+:H+ antiporter subunit E